jgi:hypothetical protein
MKHSTVPRGTTKKDICKCGRYFYKYFENQRLRQSCTVCEPPRDLKEQK